MASSDRNTCHLAGLRAIAVCMFTAFAVSPAFGDTASAGKLPVYDLHIPSQPLDDALQELARQSDVDVVFFSRLTAGKRAAALNGSYTAADALSRLLAETSLGYRQLNAQTFEVRQKSSARRTIFSAAGRIEDLEEIVVTATAQGVVATRTETPLREIPQTVSLISQAQIREQNLATLPDALERVPGLISTRDNNVSRLFIARGFAVTSYHVDGSPNLYSYKRLLSSTPDLAEFEQIEVLRGADGIFSGNGQPGASVNLVRKRPRDEAALWVSAWTGSWDNSRVELDATGPLAGDGALRGRLVGVLQDQGSNLDAVTFNRKVLFGVLDYDVGPDTVVTLGGSYVWQNDTPVFRGMLPTLDGTVPQLPHFALTTDWAFDRREKRETYFQLRQQLGDDWQLQVGAARWEERRQFGTASINISVNPATRQRITRGVNGAFSTRPNTEEQIGTDLTLTGDFRPFGLRAELAFGAEYARYRYLEAKERNYLEGPVRNLVDYTPSLYGDPRLIRPSQPDSIPWAQGTTESRATFLTARMHLTDALSISAGARAGQERYRRIRELNFSDGRITDSREIPWSSPVVTPYAALAYDVSDHYSLYASYVDIYRNTGTDMETFPWGIDSNAAPEALKPDGSAIGVRHGVTTEAGIKAAWFNGAVNGMLAAYDTRQYRIPLSLSRAGVPGKYIPGTSQSLGVDLELTGAAGGWLFGGGYTFNENRAATAVWNGVRGPLYALEQNSPETPKHLVKAWVNKRLTGRMSRWTVGGNLRAQTSQMTTMFACPNVTRTGGCIGGNQFNRAFNRYAVVDLRAGFRIDENWRVVATANNINDERYYQSAGNIQPGYWWGERRNFLLKVEGSF
ncbi:MAG: TonB-dependent receptor [Pseudomonadota bacterium]